MARETAEFTETIDGNKTAPGALRGIRLPVSKHVLEVVINGQKTVRDVTIVEEGFLTVRI